MDVKFWTHGGRRNTDGTGQPLVLYRITIQCRMNVNSNSVYGTRRAESEGDTVGGGFSTDLKLIDAENGPTCDSFRFFYRCAAVRLDVCGFMDIYTRRY